MNLKPLFLLTLLSWMGLLAAQPLPPTVAWLRADSTGIPADLGEKRLLYLQIEPGEILNGARIDRAVARTLNDYPHPAEVGRREALIRTLAGTPLSRRYDYQLHIGQDGEAYYVLLQNLHTGRWYLPDDHAYLSLGGSLKAFLRAVADPVPAQAHVLPAAWRVRCADDRGEGQALRPALASCPIIDHLGLPPGLAADTLAVVPLPADHAFAKALNADLVKQLPQDYPYPLRVQAEGEAATARYQLRVGQLSYCYTFFLSGLILEGQDERFFLFMEDRETGLRYAPAPMPVMGKRVTKAFLGALR